MHWEEVCQDPSLRNLPYKIELNRAGKILMSPAKNRHAIFQGIILLALHERLPQGWVMPECAIETDEGVKVADVAWISPERYAQVKTQAAYRMAPEICVEVLSEANTGAEMKGKIALYLQLGAKEVWICDEAGRLRFYNLSGELSVSLFVPSFPLAVHAD